MTTVPPAPPLSVSTTVASQQPLARPAVGFESVEQKLQPLPPVEAGPDTAGTQQRTGAAGDGRQGGQQGSPQAQPAPAAPDSTATAFALPSAGVAAPRFRPNVTTSPQFSPAPVAAKRRAQDLQAALDSAPPPGQLLNDSV